MSRASLSAVHEEHAADALLPVLSQLLCHLLRRPTKLENDIPIIAGLFVESLVLGMKDEPGVEGVPYGMIQNDHALSHHDECGVQGVSKTRKLLLIEVVVAPPFGQEAHPVNGTRDKMKFA